MSLSYNFEPCNIPQADYNTMLEAGVIDGMIWGMMAINMGEVTEKNVEEVHRRFKMHEVAGMGLISGGNAAEEGSLSYRKARMPNWNECHKFIGYRTNVTNMTKRQFHGDFVRRMEFDVRSITNAEKT